jgi:hydroxypyruvate reductase
MKEIARQIFERALPQSSVQEAFRRQLSCDRGVLRVVEDLYDLTAYSRVFVLSLGKAAHSMLSSLAEASGRGRFEGIVASSVEPEFYLPGFRYFQGGHPWPNQDSILAAQAMLRSLASLDQSALVIYLLSGGGSAAAEKPLAEEISLPDLVETYRVLVHCGAPIAAINTIRKHLSSIKGGRLAAAAYPAEQVSILVSDVPESSPDALSSGPTMPDSTTVEDCYRIAHRTRVVRRLNPVAPAGAPRGEMTLSQEFPPSVRRLFEQRALEETPKSEDPVFVRSRWWTILSNATLLRAAKLEAERQGFAVTIDNRSDDWDYAKAADYLLVRLRELRRESERVCLVSGGEVTVEVENGGIGGRNQQLALYAATKIVGENISLLSAGSDGVDGNSAAAGAVVDGTSLERAKAQGLDIRAHLTAFNAYPIFAALGDLVVTGPTGNNLRDLRILLAY